MDQEIDEVATVMGSIISKRGRQKASSFIVWALTREAKDSQRTILVRVFKNYGIKENQ